MIGRVAFLRMRAEAQALKGHLDVLLLAALEAGPRHGYAVKEALREGSGGRFDLPTGTVYPALHRVVVAAFTRQAPGRRTALRLLATGPLVGLCWGAGLASGHAWTWPVPVPLRLVVGTGLLLAVACLAAAATGRRYARTRLAAVGGI